MQHGHVDFACLGEIFFDDLTVDEAGQPLEDGIDGPDETVSDPDGGGTLALTPGRRCNGAGGSGPTWCW
jgi:hypothetical protein